MPTRLTTEEFQKRLRDKLPNIELIGLYRSAKSKVRVRCQRCGNCWNAIPDNLLRNVKYACSQCAHTAQNEKWKDEILTWLKEKRPDVRLVGSLTSHSERNYFQCADPNCLHMWQATFRSLKSAGSSCPECAIRRNAERKRISESEFRGWLKINRPFIELIEYKDQSTRARFRCLNPGHDAPLKEWSTIPEIIRLQDRGLQGCPDCGWRTSGKAMRTPESEKRKWMEKHKPHILMGQDYSDTKSQCTFTCLICAYKWKTSIGVFTNNDAGCPSCAGVARVTEQEFLRRLAKTTQGQITMVGRYRGYRYKTSFQCQRKECQHTWSIQPIRLTSSAPTGCPGCTPTGFCQTKQAWMYLMTKPAEQQVGITNDPITRLSTHRREGWTLLDLRGPAKGSDVLELERLIKQWLKTNLSLVKGKRENWHTVELEVQSLEELCAAASVKLFDIPSNK